MALNNFRSGLVALSLAALASAFMSPDAPAQAYPVQTVRMISPYSGGPSDLGGRVLKDRLSALWGQPVILENKTGAGGNLGAEMVARAAPDGYTLLSTSSPPLVINPFLYRNLPFDPAKDFIPIVVVSTSPLVLFVHKSVQANTLAELIALAKSRPGQLVYASGGSGTSPHLAAETFKHMAGLDILHIPYRTVGEMTLSVVSGQTNLAFGSVTGMEFVKKGDLRAIAQTGEKRFMKFMPNVPTMQEAGLPAYAALTWYALLAPRATPKPIVDKIERDVLGILADREVVAAFEKISQEIVAMGSQDFTKFIQAERARWQQAVQVSGAKVE
ncbi:MAG: tripartite tricarboxylate transporter substrate binding protein [Betaproteobacteria bacterium]|nr:tripartite tricarboxylate transporter substrate binding protein [Betaproteobacteria bacterium]